MAWSWQQIFSNLGGIIATVLPFLLTMLGMSNAPKGEVPMTVKLAYYIAAVLLIASIWTVISGINESNRNNKLNLLQLLKSPKQFWQISVVQFFNWFALMYLWTYSTGAIAKNV